MTPLQLVEESLAFDDEGAFTFVAEKIKDLTPEELELLNQSLSDLRDKVKRVSRAIQPALDEAAKLLRIARRTKRLREQLARAEAGVEEPTDEQVISLGDVKVLSVS